MTRIYCELPIYASIISAPRWHFRRIPCLRSWRAMSFVHIFSQAHTSVQESKRFILTHCCHSYSSIQLRKLETHYGSFLIVNGSACGVNWERSQSRESNYQRDGWDNGESSAWEIGIRARQEPQRRWGAKALGARFGDASAVVNLVHLSSVAQSMLS